MQNAVHNQYIVIREEPAPEPVAATLSRYPDVTVLGELDECTALVDMDQAGRERLKADHPDLVVEPNYLHHPLGS